MTSVSVAGLISAPAWAAFLLWNAVIMEICKRTFLFWLKMALYISNAFLSSVSIWNLFCGIGSLSCLIDALFYLFTEWMKKLYFGPHCTRLMKSGIASQIFVTYWLWKAKVCNLVLFLDNISFCCTRLLVQLQCRFWACFQISTSECETTVKMLGHFYLPINF